MCSNIDDFNRGAALILAALYRSFPLPLVLKTDSLDAGADLPDDIRETRLRERAAIYEAAAVFLMEEGFVRYGSQVKGGGIFTGTVLTSRGLAALNKTSAPHIQGVDTLGDKLLGFAKNTASETFRDGVKQVVLALIS